MKILLLSDVHGNIDALRAIDETIVRNARFDEVWVLGDLVDYGPAPGDVIAWVRAHATRVVRGNHDHAMGTGEDCRSSPLYYDLSVATRDYFRLRMSDEVKHDLGELVRIITDHGLIDLRPSVGVTGRDLRGIGQRGGDVPLACRELDPG